MPFSMLVQVVAQLAHLSLSRTPIQLQMLQSNASAMTERHSPHQKTFPPLWTTGLSNLCLLLLSQKSKLSLSRLLKQPNTSLSMLPLFPSLPMSISEKLMPLLQAARFATVNAPLIPR